MRFLLTTLSSILLMAFTSDSTTDYLSVKGPLKFNNTDFLLKWSDKPNNNYYIQEYLPKNETLEHFDQMLTIHLFETGIKLKDAVTQKVSELKTRKETDPVCNYQVTKSPDGKEFIVDFLLGESKNNKMTIVEFNIYHYRQIEINKKKKGIVVYAYSQRSYGDDISDFFKSLKSERVSLLNEMISCEKPAIKLK